MLLVEQGDLSGAIIVGEVRIVLLWEQVLPLHVCVVVLGRIQMLTGPPVRTNAQNVWLESSAIGMEQTPSADVWIVHWEPGVQ